MSPSRLTERKGKHGPKAGYAKRRGMESGVGGIGEGRRLSAYGSRGGGTGSPRGGDGRDLGGGEERADAEPAGGPERTLPADADYAGGQAGVARAAGPAGTLPHGSIRALPAERESAGGS